MSKVYTSASVSLDGFIAGPGESGFDHLFQWLNNGDVVMPAADRDFHMTAASAGVWNELMDRTGACVVGRYLFDITNGWNGNPPVSRPHVVLSHRGAPDGWDPVVPFTFVADGIESAVAKAKAEAGGRWVSVNGGTVASQCLSAGLLDEIWFNVVPVLLGDGVRFLDRLSSVPITLEDPDEVVQGNRITHLRYRVAR
jgi:dihydrofolate reductase